MKSNAPVKSKVVSPRNPVRSSGKIVGRKRVPIVLSDDEDAAQTDLECSKGSLKKCPIEGIGISVGNGCKPGQLLV